MSVGIGPVRVYSGRSKPKEPYQPINNKACGILLLVLGGLFIWAGMAWWLVVPMYLIMFARNAYALDQQPVPLTRGKLVQPISARNARKGELQ